MQLAQPQWFLHFLQGPLHPIHATQSGVSVHGHYYHVSGHQIQWIRGPDIGSQPPNWGPYSQAIKRLKGPWRDRSIGQCFHPLAILVSGQEAIATRHCLGIHVTLTKETGAAPPPPHGWMAPLVEYMLCYGRTGLTEAVVMGLGRAVLFYGRWDRARA